MKLSAAEQDSIIALMTRIYMEIAAIESQFHLMIGEGDFRPRIDYFHDAVRALSSQNLERYQQDGRLSVEYLAYDLSCLRYIQSMPLSPFKPHAQNLSPHSELMVPDKSLAIKKTRPDRATKEKISGLYQHYAVLFAALLKPVADTDYHERTDHLNQDVAEMNMLAEKIKQLGAGKISIEALAQAIHHVEDAGLQALLSAFLAEKKYQQQANITKLTQLFKSQTAKKDKEIAAIDTAHMNYALAQLGIFESAKDLLKKLAGQGTNLVGNFVEAAMAQTRREMGR